MSNEFAAAHEELKKKSIELTRLELLVGSFRTKSTFFSNFGTHQAQGESTFHWELSELILSASYRHYDESGKNVTFEGQEKLGFDKLKGKYFSVWFDTFASMFHSSQGDYNDQLHQFVFEGHQPNLLEGLSNQAFRTIYRFTEKGYELEIFHEKNGEFKRAIFIEAEKISAVPTLDVRASDSNLAPTTHISSVSHITLLVHDVDAALAFYVDILKFHKKKDVKYSYNGEEEVRYVVIHAPQQKDLEITVSLASKEEEKKAVGKQAPGNFFLVLNTNDVYFDYARLKDHVKFRGEPKDEFWGIQVVFEDLYGNAIDLVQPKPH